MNNYKPLQLSEYYSLDMKCAVLNKLVSSGKYIYPIQQYGTTYLITFENGILDIKGTKKPKFFKKLKNKIPKDLVIKCNVEDNVMYINDVLVYDKQDLTELPYLKRIKYIKKIVEEINNEYIQSSNFYNANNNIYNTISKFFENGGKEFTIYNKENKYEKDSAFLIDKSYLTLYKGKVIKKFEALRNYGISPNLADWLYWEDLRTGDLLYGYYSQAYTVFSKLIEPVSKDYYDGKITGILIKLSSGREIQMNADININEEITIGCIEIEDKLYYPFVMEDK